MKKIINTILFLGLFITFNVNAASIDLKLNCPNVVTSGGSGNCSVNAVVNNDSDYLLDAIEVSDTNNFEVTQGSIKINKEYVTPGDNNNIATIPIKTTKTSGQGSITITAYFILNADEEEDPVSYTKNSNVITIVNSINTLTTITINDKRINIANPNLTTYSAETTAKEAIIKATPTNSSATVSGAGTHSLVCGDNKLTLVVKATSGSTKNYTLNIKRKCEENVLKGITLSSGALSPAFNKDITDYKVRVSKNIDKITIKGVKNYDKQTITGEIENAALVFGDNNFSLTVKNEENKEKKYNITVTRDETLETTALLKSLAVVGAKLNFDPNVFEYKTKVLYNVDKVTVNAVPENPNSKVTFKGHDKLNVGENIVTVTVISDNNEKNEYKILVTRLKEGETIGDNPNIKNIIIKNYNINFSPDKEKYKLIIKDEKELDIKVEMEDEFATYQIAGNHDLKNKSIIKIVTKSSDEEKNKTYTIEIVKQTSHKIFIIIGLLLLFLLLGGLGLAYYFINKKKKEEVDINGLKLDERDAEQITTNRIIQSNGPINTPIINDSSKKQVEETKPVQSTEVKQDAKPNLHCPYCSRELLNPSPVCPYCNRKLY